MGRIFKTAKRKKVFEEQNISLETIVIPHQIDGKSVTEIGGSVFMDCSNLTTIVTQAGSYAKKWARSEGFSVQII